MISRFLLIGLFMGSCSLAGCKQNSKKPVKFPFFASLKSKKVNARCGPGFSYPIEWIYTTSLLPVEVLESYEHWYKIQDFWGDLSWVNKNLVGKLKSTMTLNSTILYEKDSLKSNPLARLDPQVHLSLRACSKEWCEVSTEDLSGFVSRQSLYAS